MLLPYILEQLDQISNFIYEHEQEFLSEFFRSDDTNKEIISIKYNSRVIEFIVLLECGTPCSYSCSIENYNTWFLKFDEETIKDFLTTQYRKNYDSTR